MTARKPKPKTKRGGRRHGLNPEGPSVRVTVSLPAHLAAWLARIALRSDRTQADVVRAALADRWAFDKEDT